MYSQRIDRLKEHLQSLQLMSVKREELERRVRTQLQDEIRDLRGREGAGGKEEGEGEDGGTTWETEVAVLQADLAKVFLQSNRKLNSLTFCVSYVPAVGAEMYRASSREGTSS